MLRNVTKKGQVIITCPKFLHKRIGNPLYLGFAVLPHDRNNIESAVIFIKMRIAI
jgi:hypothetical protein